ncbi:MAG: FG-GAP-like repeat-containing protein [Candidatus Zhuqueibacterota bacterium]
MSNIAVINKLFWKTISLLIIGALSFHNAWAQGFTRLSTSSLGRDLGGFLGTAWGDYDNDGYVDLFVANCKGPNMLFHNDGIRGFTKITTGEISTDQANSYSASWGDFDNDGDLDLFVANLSGTNFLYRNDEGILVRIKEGVVVTSRGNSTSGSWGDYDNDGDLDLFVTNDTQKNFLYQNNGDGTFTKITNSIVVNDVIVSSLVGLWADYDNDGDLDLYVVNGFFSLSSNFLYRNEGLGNFTKITTGSIVTDVEGSTGGSWGDYNNDGYLDLYVCNSVNNARNSLYRNNGNGTFTKIFNGSIVTDTGHSVGSSWIDYDNDGDLDLFVVNVFAANNILYRNNGNGSFSKITSGAIVNDTGYPFGCSWADFDNDGDQDAIVTNGGFSLTMNNFFYRNDQSQHNWITIQLKGTTGNSSAIGAMVRVKATVLGKTIWQVQQIAGQSGFLGQNSLDAEFGLGDATTIDSIIIKWPSGNLQVLTDVEANQFLKIVEEQTTEVFQKLSSKASLEYNLADNYPNPFNANTIMEYQVTQAGNVRINIFNLLGQKVITLVDEMHQSGRYSILWDGIDGTGNSVPSGMYFYKMEADKFSATKKMLLLE